MAGAAARHPAADGRREVPADHQTVLWRCDCGWCAARVMSCARPAAVVACCPCTFPQRSPDVFLHHRHPALQFLDAFQRTGRIVNISVVVSRAAGRGHDLPLNSLLLNYLVSPNVLLWSAVAASCALPGLMPPVTLMAKDWAGRTVPFHPPGG